MAGSRRHSRSFRPPTGSTTAVAASRSSRGWNRSSGSGDSPARPSGGRPAARPGRRSDRGAASPRPGCPRPASGRRTGRGRGRGRGWRRRPLVVRSFCQPPSRRLPFGLGDPDQAGDAPVVDLRRPGRAATRPAPGSRARPGRRRPGARPSPRRALRTGGPARPDRRARPGPAPRRPRAGRGAGPRAGSPRRPGRWASRTAPRGARTEAQGSTGTARASRTSRRSRSAFRTMASRALTLAQPVEPARVSSSRPEPRPGRPILGPAHVRTRRKGGPSPPSRRRGPTGRSRTRRKGRPIRARGRDVESERGLARIERRRSGRADPPT